MNCYRIIGKYNYHKLKMKNEIMIQKEEEANKFKSTIRVCSNKFNNKNETIRDHDYFTCKFRRAACNKYNLNQINNVKIRVPLIRNLKYDSKIFLCQLVKNDEYE